MPYLVDTDWLIDHLEGDTIAIELLERLEPQGIAFSVITYMEALQGIARSPDPLSARVLFDELCTVVPLIPITPGIAARCAMVREDLRTRGRRVRSRALDLLIAATAIELDLVLVTRNISDYSDITGVRVL